MDSFHEVHVISDLHLGGDAGHQIFTGAERLCKFIDSLARLPERRRVALVVNGDFVDFLAGKGATYFDPLRATTRVQLIARNPAFAEIFAAFRGFAGTPERTLVIVLGNHDIELALPNVQRALLTELAGEDPAAHGRVLWSVGGAGFAASVGGGRVLCLHGNEVDPFNITDYETLLRAARDQVFGWTPKAKDWVPNAGTKLVIEIMNGLKQSLPFIDLLKPETDAVVPILFALDQLSVTRLLDAIQVASRTSWDILRQATGFLSLEDSGVGSAAATSEAEKALPRADAAVQLSEILGRAFEPYRSGEEDHFVNGLLDKTEEYFAQGMDPFQLAATSGQDKLGVLQLSGASLRAAWAKLLACSESERLRAALRHLHKDKTFDRQRLDADFKRIDQIIPVDIDVVIAGHTHLERFHRRGSGGLYINTGTWARLMRVTPAILDDPARFAQFYEAVRLPSIDDLDKTDFVTHRPSVASIVEQSGMFSAKLCHVRADGATETAPEGDS
jgi:UDP-2,3-diacylglucosamine pyrophosphatase LpxH